MRLRRRLRLSERTSWRGYRPERPQDRSLCIVLDEQKSLEQQARVFAVPAPGLASLAEERVMVRLSRGSSCPVSVTGSVLTMKAL